MGRIEEVPDSVDDGWTNGSCGEILHGERIIDEMSLNEELMRNVCDGKFVRKARHLRELLLIRENDIISSYLSLHGEHEQICGFVKS